MTGIGRDGKISENEKALSRDVAQILSGPIISESCALPEHLLHAEHRAASFQVFACIQFNGDKICVS